MARESRRRRDERRFGRPERLADLIAVRRYAIIQGFVHGPGMREYEARLRGETESAIASRVIEASNVFDYTQSLEGSGKLKYDAMIVNATPPFDCCFVEMAVPPSISPITRRLGWAIQSYDRGKEPEIVYEALTQVPAPEAYARCRWVVVGTLSIGALLAPGSETMGVLCPAAQAIIFLDDAGDSIQPPYISIPTDWAAIGQDDWIQNWAHSSFFDCLLAFCFMNCKNVALQANDPDRGVNRERERAGLRPFVRYHTIHIEPMKSVLRTEGNVDANGLAKALHIVRGHFANYTEDRPLFGRPGLHGKFWMPAHVRGSAKAGVVVSDYEVSPR